VAMRGFVSGVRRNAGGGEVSCGMSYCLCVDTKRVRGLGGFVLCFCFVTVWVLMKVLYLREYFDDERVG